MPAGLVQTTCNLACTTWPDRVWLKSEARDWREWRVGEAGREKRKELSKGSEGL